MKTYLNIAIGYASGRDRNGNSIENVPFVVL